MRVQPPTELKSWPATKAVAVKGISQFDIFSKYAAAFFNAPRSPITSFSARLSQRSSFPESDGTLLLEESGLYLFIQALRLWMGTLKRFAMLEAE